MLLCAVVMVYMSIFVFSFSAVIAKLFELGVPESQWATSEPWIFASLDHE